MMPMFKLKNKTQPRQNEIKKKFVFSLMPLLLLINYFISEFIAPPSIQENYSNLK